MVEVNVAGLMLDSSNMPVVLLREKNGERVLPIWIGPMEAMAIQTGLENSTPARPMSHDLICSVIRGMGGVVSSIEVNDLKDDTFFALVHIDRGGENIVIDSRPSDAIAISVRFNSKIFVAVEVFDKMHSPDSGSKAEKDKWAELLENLGPEAFGKYKM